MADPRYPIGSFRPQPSYTSDERREWILELGKTASALRTAVAGLSDEQLETPYREGGWTVRQVAHHLPDSHMNAYIRVKLAVTETDPTIKPYDETQWALLADTKQVSVGVSVALLEALHLRWASIFASLSEAEWKRVYRHPVNGAVSLERALAEYAWHGQHHIAQITGLRERNGW